MKTDVIIIGAGPTGLSLGCQLIRYGIDFIILDHKKGVTHLSKALGVHARTLEIYEQLDLAEQAVAQGEVARQVKLIAGGHVQDGFDLSNMGQHLSLYPYMLVLEQSKNEQLLYKYLQAHRKDVRWNTAFEGLTQDETGVQATIRNDDGELQTIRAKYLVGCDGAKSPVRHALDLTLLGDTFAKLFYVADVKLDWDLSPDLYFCVSRTSFLTFFPMQGGNWRILGNLPEYDSQSQVEIDYEEIERQVKAEAKLPLEILEVNWFSTYRVHTRRVGQFARGRCFLAGDSAHIHTPAGGQGMNTGIQDAYNLAWKLAFVLKGYANESLLNTYNQERLENAKNLVETTDKAFELEAGSDWLVSFVRTVVLPPVAKYVFSIDRVQRTLFSLISQISISYPDSQLSHPSSERQYQVKVGDRMPYFLIKGKSIYDYLYKPKFHLLTFSDGQCNLSAIAQKVEQEYRHLVDYQVLPLLPPVMEAFGVTKSFYVLLRPDNHIGFMTQDNSREQIHIEVEFAPQSAIAHTQSQTQVMPQAVLDHPQVEAVHWFIGESAPKFYYNLTGSRQNRAHYAQAIVQLKTGRGVEQIVRDLQQQLDGQFPAARVLVQQLQQGPPYDAPLEVRLLGPNLDTLRELGMEVRKILTQVPDVVQVRDDLSEVRPKLQLAVDEEQAQQVGLSNSAIAQQLAAYLEGAMGDSLLEATEELPVRVRITNVERGNLREIAALNLRPEQATDRSFRPTSALGDFALVPERANIARRNEERVNTVQAYITAGVLPSVVLSNFQAALEQANFELPPGYRYEFGGEQAESQRAVGNLLAYVPLLVVLMLAALVLSLGSFRQAGIIAAVAVGSIGMALFSLRVFGAILGFMAIIGSMGLVGIAINDSVIVLSALNDHPDAKAGKRQAIIHVVIKATRHVVTTTITTIAGFVPLLVSGGMFWQPLAIAIAGGISGSSLLALYFVPTVYYLVYRGQSQSQPGEVLSVGHQLNHP